MGQMTPPTALVEAGFAVILQDCRGRFDSDGEWTYVHADVDDGYDTIEWAAAQPWSNGRVGMFGGSCMGVTRVDDGDPATAAPRDHPPRVLLGGLPLGRLFRFRRGRSPSPCIIGWTAGVVASMAATWGIDDPKLKEILQATTTLRAAVIAAEPNAVEGGAPQGQEPDGRRPTGCVHC